MLKLVTTESFDTMLQNLGSMISVVETNAMHKSAASNAMSREMLLTNKPDKDHFLLHIIALGDHERYGQNRNQDAFPKAANQRYHSTFTKHAHFFREHKNQDPKYKIGDIKASIYNEEMGRVELAVWGHKKLASDVYDKLKGGKGISGSMACTVPYDRDNCTSKLARNPTEYEPHMKTRPGQWIEEFQKFAFVHNDHPRFFDYSYVSRPADRIAHYLDYILNTEENEGFAKAASSNIVPGALLAKAAGIQSPLTSEIYDLDKRSILIKLAEAEGDYEIAKGKKRPETDLDHFVKIASFTFNPRDTITDTEISAMRRLQPGTLFAELGKRAVTLPFPAFVAYATGKSMADVNKDKTVKAASLQLPKVFRKMLSGILPFAEGEEDMFDGHRMTFMSSLDPECDGEIDKLFKSLEARYSVEPTVAGHRTMSVSILFDDKDTEADKETSEEDEDVKTDKKKDTEKSAAERLAGLYGLYKLAALREMQKNAKLKLDNSLLLRVVSQNQ